MSKKILIAEDDFKIRKLIKAYFLKENYIIIEASTGTEAISQFKDNKDISLAILDIMMPELDGYSVCEEIREISDIPIILLTAKSEEEDKLLGYELGADEYVTKPFSPKVLVAKVKAIFKRTDNSTADKTSKNLITISSLTIDLLKKSAYINSVAIHLSPREYDLLEYLALNQNIVFSRTSLLDSVWGFDFLGDPRTVDTHIKRVREKLEDYSDLIKTVRGKGYMFCQESSNV